MISASDTLAAVKALYEVANKVKDNKNELLCLLKRIEHIVETLNECRSRDIIRSDECNDALSAIFDIITFTQTLTQRLLKRNLVYRVWNAGKIASEISRLNDDVQNYLSVHMVQALDLILSSKVEHQNVLASNTEEIRVKVAELDHFMRTHIPLIKSQAQTNRSFNAISQASISGFSFNNQGAGTMNNKNIGNTYYNGPFNAVSQTKRGIEFLMEWVATDAFHTGKELYDAPKCHPRTRIAVLDNIMKWVNESAGEAKDDFIMWLFGPAGAGKSAIARTIAELADQQGLLIGTFFFSRTSATRNTQDPLIATLAYQLALSIPETRSEIEDAIELDPAIFNKNLEIQIDTLLVKPFQSAQTEIVPSRKLIIIDGLDECNNSKAQVAILNAISRSFSPKHNLHIKFLVASRSEIDLINSFNCIDPLKSVHRRLALDDIYRPDDDIRLFFSDKFKEIRSNHWSRLTIPTPWPTEESLERLVKKSSGQFIFAATVVKFVESNRHRPVAQLDIIFGISPSGTWSPFAELDALYSQILFSVEDITLALRVLSLYTAAPNLAKQLGKSAELFLSLEEGDIEMASIYLSSIVSYDESSGEVKILHASLVDFLSDKRRSNKFYIDMGSTRTNFACRTLQCVKVPDGIQAGDSDLFEAGLRLDWIPNSQLRSDILNFDLDAFLTVTHRFDEWHQPMPADISSICFIWMSALTKVGLEGGDAQEALYRYKNSFELWVEKHQSDWRLQAYRPDDDIRQFFFDKFEEIRSNHLLRSTIPTPWPTEKSLEKLVKKSSGQFIFAATVVKFVESSRHRPVARLSIIFGISPSGTMTQSPFAELDELYSQILSSVDDIKLTLRVLSLYAAAPFLAMWLELEKSAEQFLSLEEGDINFALSELSSIVSYDDFGRVKILHAPFFDFLSDKRRSNEFYVDMGSARTDFACRTLQCVKAPDGIQAGDFYLYWAGLDRLGWIPNTQLRIQLRSSILDFDLDAFITAVTYRNRESPLASGISGIYFRWMSTLNEAGLEGGDKQEALDRCNNSFKLRVERYQLDWRLQLLLTLAVVMRYSVRDGVVECRCLDILLEMDSHDLHLVDRHALDLRHDRGLLDRLLTAYKLNDITSIYVDGDRYASAALHCMSFLSNPPTYYVHAEWKATCDMALVLLCELLQRANASQELVQFINNYDIDLEVRQKISVIQVDEHILAYLHRANASVREWRIMSTIQRVLFATDEPLSKYEERQKITRLLTPKCEECCTVPFH